MSLSRPLPKSLLKKMFLKVLHEHKCPGGAFQGHSWSYPSILQPKIAQHFGIEPLTDEEYEEALRGVYELERDGYIMQDTSQRQSSEFKMLTAQGKSAVGQSLEEMELPSIDIDQLLDRDDLREAVHDVYLDSDFEIAVFKAFKLLEEYVRSMADLPADCIGAGLMKKAFRPAGGVLAPPTEVEAEKEAFHLLMRGAIMWFKNPGSHRTVGYQDDVQAAHVLGFANLLLNLVDECRAVDPGSPDS